MTEEQPISFGLWNPPGNPFPITYSVPLLQEIDFFVAEGYRRIPHGGLEVGGLLYGRWEEQGLVLLAFESIECQHRFGPTFILSDSDLAALRRQTTNPFVDELNQEELELAGWFISHSRGDLTVREQEAALFEELFPGPQQVTMLVKPERYKPTRYGLAVRPEGSPSIDPVCRDPFILPLSLKSGEATARAGVNGHEFEKSDGKTMAAAAGAGAVIRAESVSEFISEPASAVPEPALEVAPAAVVTDAAAPPVMAPAPEVSAPVDNETPVATPAVEPQMPLEPPTPAEPPVREVSKPVLKEARHHSTLAADDTNAVEIEDTHSRTQWVKVVLGCCLVLASIAAVLWGYLNFFLPPIPLRTDITNGSTSVSWPREMAEGVPARLIVYSAGQSTERLVTPQEVQNGFAILPKVDADATVELQTQHWVYSRSGQIHVIHVPDGTPTVASSESAVAAQAIPAPQPVQAADQPSQPSTSAVETPRPGSVVAPRTIAGSYCDSAQSTIQDPATLAWANKIVTAITENRSCQLAQASDDPGSIAVNTNCSVVSGSILGQAYGIRELSGNASRGSDEVADLLRSGSARNWTDLGAASDSRALDRAKEAANAGRLVLAVWKDRGSRKSGPNAIIGPGPALESRSWHGSVPPAASFGLGKPTKGFVGKPLSCAFPYEISRSLHLWVRGGR